MSAPSFKAAVDLARPVLAAEGRDAANALLSRLLWHVEGDAGGFIGLHDEALVERVAYYRLDLAVVQAAAWAPGAWPTKSNTEQRAA